MHEKPIGCVKGPGDRQHEFFFVTSDKYKLKSGEFVYYNLENKKIMCRVVKRYPLKTYPDSFLLNPEFKPEEIMKVLEVESDVVFEVKACIMGYYDDKLGFVNPRIPPPPGEPIYLAEETTIQRTLMKKRVGELGSLHVGYLLNRDEEIPVVLDTALVTSEHMCILASTGSGKSYLAGVIAEELAKPYNKAALLILDPHGEYHTLKEMEGIDEFKSENYTPYVRVFDKNEVKVRLCELEYQELVKILPNLSDKMEALLKKAYEGLPEKFTSEDLIRAIEEFDGEGYTSKALSWRIRRYIQGMDVIDDYIHIELKDVLRPGQVSVLQLLEMSDLEQQVLVSVLLNRILNARINAEKDREGEKLEYPVFLIVEEAHRFASKDAKSYDIMKTILAEGRKFGVGVCLISQRPSKIDSDILSQCMTQIVMRIVNPADQENVKSGVESIGRDLLEELPGLTKGQAIVAGVSINAPVLMRVRKRLTPHGGVSKNAPEDWDRWLSLNTETLKSGERKEKKSRAKTIKLFWE